MRNCGPGSSVRIATGYGLYGPGIETRCRRDFLHLSRPVLGPTQPPVKWVPAVSPGVKIGRVVTLTLHPLLVSWSRKRRAIPVLPRMDRTTFTEPQCLYNGALYLYLYLYSPYGPYGLYRASVPVEGCTLPYLIIVDNLLEIKSELDYS